MPHRHHERLASESCPHLQRQRPYLQRQHLYVLVAKLNLGATYERPYLQR